MNFKTNDHLHPNKNKINGFTHVSVSISSTLFNIWWNQFILFKKKIVSDKTPHNDRYTQNYI